jgi:tetratricopeptide (TPR) repeat protein
LKVVKVQEVGDQEIIDKLNTQEGTQFADVKESLEEVRLRASDLFSKRKIDSAIKLYHRILQAAKFSITCNEQEETARNDVLIRTHTNLAVCSNKKGDFSETLFHVRNLELLGGINDQPKILYAKGIALMKLGEYDDAVDPLTKALKLKPLDKQIVEAVEELDKRKRAYDDERQAFGKNLGFR